jgi:hypothetical protein
MSYAKEREQNIARNKALLDGLGINPLRPKCEPNEKLRKKAVANKRRFPLPESDELDELVLSLFPSNFYRLIKMGIYLTDLLPHHSTRTRTSKYTELM